MQDVGCLIPCFFGESQAPQLSEHDFSLSRWRDSVFPQGSPNEAPEEVLGQCSASDWCLYSQQIDPTAGISLFLSWEMHCLVKFQLEEEMREVLLIKN